MTVTEVLPDGNYVVSTWGEEYVLDTKNSVITELVSYKIESEN